MLPHALGPKGLRVATHGNNQLIPSHLKHLPLGPLALQIPHALLAREPNALRGVLDRFLDLQRAPLEVHPVRPALEELRALLLAFARPRGFQRATEFQRPHGRRGQEGREGEVGAG